MSQDGDLILKILLNILPYYIREADEILTLLSQPSKPYLFQKKPLQVLSNDNFKYYKLYLEPHKIYEEFNVYCSHQFREEYPNGFDTEEFLKKYPKQYPAVTFDDLDNVYKELTDELILNVNSQNKFDNDFKYIINVALARFFDSLSLIENKKMLSDILIEALFHNDCSKIPLAVSIDPNVLKISEINDLILNQDLKTRALINRKNSSAIEKSFISNKKNTISHIPLFYISLVDSFGLIDGVFPLPYNVHLYVADKVGALKEMEDTLYFSKLFRNFKKSKKSRNKLKKV